MPSIPVTESPFRYVLAITDDWSEVSVSIDDYEIPNLVTLKSLDLRAPQIIYIAVSGDAAMALLLEVLPTLVEQGILTWFSTEPRALYVGM